MKLHGLGACAALALALACGPGQAPEIDAMDATGARLAELARQAAAHSAADRRDEARATLREMAEEDPEHPWPYELSAKLHYRWKEPMDEARAFARSLGSSGPGQTYGLAVIDYYEDAYVESVRSLEPLVALYEEMGHTAGQAFCHRAIGMNFSYQKKRRADAIEPLEEAQRLFRRIGYRSWVAVAMADLASVHRRLGQRDVALGLLRQALAIQVQLGDRAGEGKIRHSIGFAHNDSREYDLAVGAFEKALAARRESGQAWPQYLTLKELAVAYDRSGQYEQALETEIEAAVFAERINRPEQACRHRQTAGLKLSALDRHDEALEQLRLGVENAEKTGRPGLLAAAHRDLGRGLCSSGRYAAAARAQRAALEALGPQPPDTKPRLLEGSILTNLCNALRATGDLAQALIAQRRGLTILEEVGSPGNRANAANNLGTVYTSLGLEAEAERYFALSLRYAQEATRRAVEKSSPLLQNSSRDKEARARGNLGVVLAARGKLDEALAHQQEAIRIRELLGDPASIANSRIPAADTLWLLDRKDEAEHLVAEALSSLRDTGDRLGEMRATNLSAGFRRMGGRIDEALALYDGAEQLARAHEVPRQLREAVAGRAAALERAGRWDDALTEYRRALALFESQRDEVETDELRMRFVSTAADIQGHAVALQARLDRRQDAAAPEAFRLAERSRSLGLVDLLSEARTAPRLRLPPDVARREAERIDAVSLAAMRFANAEAGPPRERARRELRSAEEALSTYRVERMQTRPGQAEMIDPEPTDLDALRSRILLENETLLRYFIGPDQALLWIIQPDAARCYVLEHPAEIAAGVERFLELSRSLSGGIGGTSRIETAAEQLAAMLLPAPLPAGRRLIVVPDGPLQLLPFETLRRDGRYLVEDHEIVVAPSATALQVMREHPLTIAASGFLGAGDPVATQGDTRFPALRHSARSLARIAATFPTGNRTLLERDTFTKPRLRELPLAAFRFVHVSTHGWLDPDNPRRVGLRLSPPAEGDEAEFLYLDDVFRLDLAAELVVLAACSTGQGELLPGEGIVGLTRAFLYAGARSVLVSQWNVSDAATADFMETFYARLAEGRTTPDALRRAKLAFLESDQPARRLPYSWAPFVLVGNPAPSAARLNPEVAVTTETTDGGS